MTYACCEVRNDCWRLQCAEKWFLYQNDINGERHSLLQKKFTSNSASWFTSDFGRIKGDAILMVCLYECLWAVYLKNCRRRPIWMKFPESSQPSTYFRVWFDGFSVLVDGTSDECHVDVVAVSEIIDEDIVSAAVRRRTRHLHNDQQSINYSVIVCIMSRFQHLSTCSVYLPHTRNSMNVVTITRRRFSDPQQVSYPQS